MYLLDCSTVDKLSHSGFCSKRLMRYNNLLNIFNALFFQSRGTSY